MVKFHGRNCILSSEGNFTENALQNGCTVMCGIAQLCWDPTLTYFVVKFHERNCISYLSR